MFREEQGCSQPAAINRSTTYDAAHPRVSLYHRLSRRHGLPPFFAKHLKQQVPESRTAFQREALLHRVIQEERIFTPVREHLPVCFGYDNKVDLLLFEFLSGYESLQDQIQQKDFSTDVAYQLGLVLSRLHGIEIEGLEAEPLLAHMPGHRPATLDLLNRAFTRDEDISTGMVEYMQQLVIRPVIAELFNLVKEQWQTNGLIHHNLTPDHIMVSVGQGEIKLVNWGLADRGDTAWDVGTVLQNYLLQPILNGDIHSAYSQRHISWHLPLQMTYQALSGFVSGYLSGRPLSSHQQQLLLIRALHCCAARMILTGYELHRREKKQLPITTAILNLAISLFAEPESIALALMQTVVPGQQKAIA